uniref:Uncharacterized protein n=1 Tax=Euplotes crassus TaxID=5936 RepID=A0A7S3NX71_EUPCR
MSSITSFFFTYIWISIISSFSCEPFFYPTFPITSFSRSQVGIISCYFLKPEQISSRIIKPRIFKPEAISAPFMSVIWSQWISTRTKEYIFNITSCTTSISIYTISIISWEVSKIYSVSS